MALIKLCKLEVLGLGMGWGELQAGLASTSFYPAHKLITYLPIIRLVPDHVFLAPVEGFWIRAGWVRWVVPIHVSPVRPHPAGEGGGGWFGIANSYLSFTGVPFFSPAGGWGRGWLLGVPLTCFTPTTSSSLQKMNKLKYLLHSIVCRLG